jgi:class 3 adenylate cyclase/tetratricopeptide (TPR) repeat protein
MTQPICPSCGQPIHDPNASPLVAAANQDLARTQAQLMVYAQDLARAYARQKHMAQYLPSELRDRISSGSDQVKGERRYVTVLFADLVNFTQLASRLDAEEVFRLVNACFRRLVSHIFRFGGVVENLVGDGIMAIFGAPIAHEDDPARAVLTALDMQAEMQKFSQAMEPYLGVPLQLRIGVNCGDVIAGSLEVDEQLWYTVIGRTVNLAFRLQELAEPGKIAVSQAVQQQTEHQFDYHYLGEFKVKGIEGPVPVFAVHGRQETQTSSRLTGSIQLPWTGRQRELDQLTQALRQLETGGGRVLLVRGEAGVGKSRLVRQWLATLQGREVTVWSGIAHMFQRRVSYSLWRDVLCQTVPGPAGGPPSAQVAGSLSGPDASTILPTALDLIHLPTGQPEADTGGEDTRRQVSQAVRELVAVQAQRRPLVVVIDNWQWADDMSRQLLFDLLPLAECYPVLFLILSRVEGDTTQDPCQEFGGHAGHRYARMDLAPLDATDSQGLLSTLINPETLPREAQAMILGWSQGNPFFLEELTRWMVAEGIIELNRDQWQVVHPERLVSLRIPPTLRGLARANLDRLPDELQEVMNYAAVIGSPFSFRLLQAVMGREREVSRLRDQLKELASYGIIEPAGPDGDAFAFRHMVVQETIYESLLSIRRQAMHRLVADEMDMLPESDIAADVELIAYHFVQAGVPAKAVPYLIRAGQRAQEHSAHKLAVEHYLAALTALDYAPRYRSQRVDLEIALANVYRQSQQHTEARKHYQAALDLTGQLEKRIELYQWLSQACAAQGDLDQAWRQLEWALELLAAGNVPATSPVRGRVYADCAGIEWRMGDERRAELWAREAIAILESTRQTSRLAASYETLSHIYAGLGQSTLAEQYAARAASRRAEPHHPA